MQTIKTAVVVVLLLVVLYGAYIAINGSETELPAELKNILANESDVEIDVSMPSFDTSSMTPGSGFMASAPFASNSENKPNFGGSTGPNPAFGSPAAPQPLAPPKLASIPSFAGRTDSDPSLSPPTLAKETQPAEKIDSQPGPAEVPSFSLNLDGAASNSSLALEQSPSPLSPPSPIANAPKPLSSPSATSIPGKVASQTTPSVDEPPVSTAEPNGGTPQPGDEVKELTEKKANITGRSFDNAKRAALEQVERGEFKEALAKMSAFYNSPELTAEQNLDLINLLDSLAAETIYSRRHLLDTPYSVAAGETLEDIAKRYAIPAELLGRINAVDPTIGLLPGTRLKVFQGPFRAEVDVNRHEMTIFLGELYAGRFPVSFGSDPQPKEGVYQVLDKQRHRNYYGKGGIQIDGSDPRNPYGGWWIGLAQELSIHGSPDNPGADNSNLGCISLSPLDASDVFSMLSRTSQVTIKR